MAAIVRSTFVIDGAHPSVRLMSREEKAGAAAETANVS
jgi:hypothetical protein